MPDIDLSQYYTPEEAAAVLSKNSGKRITANYVRQLVVYGKISKVKIHERLNVYLKAEIDRYIVEDPGKKSGRAKQAKSREKHEPANT